jgi:hypothetical protein
VRMGSVIVVKQTSTGEAINITTTLMKWMTVTEDYLCTRFGLSLREIVQIYRETDKLGSPGGTTERFYLSPYSVLQKDWILRGGRNYCLACLGDAQAETSPLEVKGKAPVGVIVTKLSDDSDQEDEVKVINPWPVKLDSKLGSKPDVGADWLEGGFPDQVSLNPSLREILDQLNKRQDIAPDVVRPQVYRMSVLMLFCASRGQVR